MVNFLAVSVFFLTTPAFAGTPLQHATAIASELAGVSIVVTPVTSTPATAPAKPSKPKKSASEWAGGSGLVMGSAFMNCSAPRDGSGWMSGHVMLSGSIPVHGPRDFSGTIRVSGSVFVNGSCRNGQGFVSGNGRVNGWGTLYDRSGKAAGTAQVSSPVFISQFVSGSYLWVNQSVSVSGDFTAN